ncbi:MAG TPA: acetyl-CoA carboxylase biotin carboxyl carrier protein [Candidatus Avimonas sp.]|nr:acetyl-CoA carboxylase biotin carboxyl carrier protein [Clostridiales bacterium]HPU58122.1 acetyl-CoA carboxylase biotin carboxyl carrier protein [Candidatus Avimonas sp.]
MDLSEIRQLMQEFSGLPITKLSLELDNLKLCLEKEGTAEKVEESRAPACQPITVVAQSSGGSVSVVEESPEEKGEVAVRSPVVGVFYITPSPGAEPFVAEGQYVKKGQTVCIVEAMKMMNEIPAPVSGRVTRIVVSPEEAVEFNQPLMFIKEE